MIEAKYQANEPDGKATRSHIKSPSPHDVIKGRNPFLPHFRERKRVVVREVLLRFFFAVNELHSFNLFLISQEEISDFRELV